LRVLPNGREHIVQYGIVRIATDRLPKDVVTRIQAGGTPLGRILIEADLHRAVRCVSLFEIVPGPHFSKLCPGLEPGVTSRTYGRFATISISSEPVIELFEVVIPPVGEFR
jgi:chorismate-pyruvate lyase